MSMTEHHFEVPGMSCEHCEVAVKSELLKVDGVYKVDVNLDTKGVKVEHDPVVDTAALRRAIEHAGYEIRGQ